MKKTLIIIAALLGIVLVAAGSFWAGMTYKSNQADQARQNFMNQRGFSDQGQMPGGFPSDAGQFQNGGRGFPGGGTSGVIKTIDGNVMTISTAQDVTTVNLSEDTPVEQTVQAGISVLQPGMRVMVTGEADADGNITAVQVRVINSDFPGMAYPYPMGTEP